MTIPNLNKVYPRNNDYQTVYLKNVITKDNIKVGDYTIYNDFYDDPPYTIVSGVPAKAMI